MRKKIRAVTHMIAFVSVEACTATVIPIILTVVSFIILVELFEPNSPA